MPDSIYTRKGDKGKTGLLTGERVEKDNPQVEAYGTLFVMARYANIGEGDGEDIISREGVTRQEK